jgi:CubicO group peptidase (beta-lactamase class C family)
VIGGQYADAIDQIVSAAISRQAIPGLAILVAQHGQVIFARGYGLRDVADGLPVERATSFRIASISKQFTAAAIMQLKERELLTLNDQVGRYLPWFRYAPDVTIRHLMTHSSGIAGYTETDDFDLRCVSAADPREIIETVLDREPAFAPGGDWQYSNTNYVILGSILETVAQKSYAEIVHQDLLGALDLPSTVPDDSALLSASAAMGVSAIWLGPWEPANGWHPSWAFGTAGLRSNVLDLFAWNVALREGRVISESSFRAMTTSAALSDGQDVAYGFGFVLGMSPVGRVRRHSGGLPGFSLDNTTFVDHEIDVIVLANCGSLFTQRSITRPIVALLTNEPRLCSIGFEPEAPSGRPISHPGNALSLVELFLAERLDGDRITDRFRRFLTPARKKRIETLRLLGPLLSLHAMESARRDPVTIFSYRAEFEARTVRTDVTIRDDGRVDDLAISRWELPVIHGAARHWTSSPGTESDF